MEGLIRMTLAGRELDGVPDWIQLLPPGKISPSGKKGFLVDGEARRSLMESFSSLANDLVVDYEHQSLSGSEAPAAGWIKELEDRGDEAEGGIWGRVEWTARAVEYLKGREYRYFSPVVLIRKKDGRAVELLGGGLTNLPAIDGMVPVVNKKDVDKKEDEGMLKKLKELLGLPETASEDEVVSACTRLKGMQDGVLEALGMGAGAALSEVKGTIYALKQPTGPTREEVQALKDELAALKAEDAVKEALKAGKITPAMESWARDIAKKDPEAFADYCRKVVPVINTGKVATGDGPAGGEGLDGATLAVCKLMGNKPEDVKKTLVEAGKEG